ncbi:MAG: hypothetical protein WAU78_13050 [Roseiarcus sp.]
MRSPWLDGHHGDGGRNAAKGLDVGDKALARALASWMIHALRQQWRRGLLTGEGKAKGARIWTVSPQGTA